MSTDLENISIKGKNLYEQDYYLWLETLANQIRSGNFDALDWENLLEELENFGRSEKNALKSRLAVLLLHLLKYQYQPSHRSNSWLCTINEQRRQINFVLEDSPSLQSYLTDIFEKCYTVARRDAASETGLFINIFPKEVPFTIEDTVNFDWLPE
ncbi:protein of unknown function DUF29 [Crinalium epipsammum PCC 9333]|uniref:DUF29 domain-containing protein n=1 Tax=Crinalium epipsammum PCC 9333 TaxID=1173022 RepID=K9VYB6_9CYAN|nr:DUF29 domain-containing protein [Crinalium epipsammum]AFZ12966.1 protein of unknown function DUF29 [Crinalium epipsammum PCC 9333]